MLRTDGTRGRRAPSSNREPKRSATKQKERERRFLQRGAGAWHERLCAQDRARRALRKHGVLIRLRLLLRDAVSDAAARDAAGILRREGFIVWRDQNAFLLTGEPRLALTFMDMTARAGLLSRDLHVPLKKILRSAAWLRAENRPDILCSLQNVLALFHSIDSPG